MKQLYILFFGCILSLASCKKEVKSKIDIPKTKSTIKYAKGFDIIDERGSRKLVIKSPYKNADGEYIHDIIDRKNDTSRIQGFHSNDIHVPVKNIVATSTTHIPMIELLNEEESIIGFPYSNYISSNKTRALINEGKIKEVGKENSLNTEILLDLEPELVIGYSVNSADKSLMTLYKAGISVIYNGDWLEETPLGRAEWIKFFGVLFNKEKEADSIFNHIEKEYLQAKEIAKKATTKPSILSGAIMSKDIWNLPAGDSFVAQYLQDANTNYLWRETTGKGSLSISFESVLDKAQNADFWIAPGYFSTKEQLLKSNKQYANFNAFKNDNLYTPNLKKGTTGGVIYFELAPTRPDLVLKDIIKITHPSLLPNYEFTFFERMK